MIEIQFNWSEKLLELQCENCGRVRHLLLSYADTKIETAIDFAIYNGWRIADDGKIYGQCCTKYVCNLGGVSFILS